MFVALLGIRDPDLNAAAVAALTAFAVLVATLPLKEWVRFRVEWALHARKADTDYLIEQRKALASVIAAHHGRLVDAADRLCHRLVRISNHADDDWLDPARPGSDRYFLDSTLYRFVMVLSAAEALEREGLVIDRRVGRRDDQRLVWYARALRWSLTSADLFHGTGYDPDHATAHFYTDMLRDMSTRAAPDGDDASFGALRPRLQDDPLFEPVREFFTGLHRGELRWDRLMVARLILMGLLNDFGDDVQKSSQTWFDRVAGEIEHEQVVDAFGKWLPRFELDSKPIRKALRRRHRGNLRAMPDPATVTAAPDDDGPIAAWREGQ